MLQTINHRRVYVVNLYINPELLLPITWMTPQEEPYAKALQHAIKHGNVTEPGKYGIELIRGGEEYNVYAIKE